MNSAHAMRAARQRVRSTYLMGLVAFVTAGCGVEINSSDGESSPSEVRPFSAEIWRDDRLIYQLIPRTISCSPATRGDGLRIVAGKVGKFRPFRIELVLDTAIRSQTRFRFRGTGAELHRAGLSSEIWSHDGPYRFGDDAKASVSIHRGAGIHGSWRGGFTLRGLQRADGDVINVWGEFSCPVAGG